MTIQPKKTKKVTIVRRFVFSITILYIHQILRQIWSMLHLTPALDTYMVFQGVVAYRLFLDRFLKYH
jgi:hypothetical protein